MTQVCDGGPIVDAAGGGVDCGVEHPAVVGLAGQETPVSERKVPCEVYSRIVGYLRPVHDWGPGKVQEFADRKNYTFKPESFIVPKE